MKLKHYSALAASLLALKNDADAQIVYTDIPDTTIYAGDYYNPAGYALDLNNDGVTDFHFYFRKDEFATGNYQIQFFTFNEYLSSNANELMGMNHDASVLQWNDTISNQQPWITASSVYLGYFASSFNTSAGTTVNLSSGNWLQVTDGFVGLRLVQGATYYGWLRMDVDITDHVTIKDYAYQSDAGQNILAGAGIPVPVEPVVNDGNLQVFPNPASDFVNVRWSDDNLTSALCTVTDLDGKVLLSKRISSSENMLDISMLSSGIYLLRLVVNQATVQKKLVVARP